MAIVYRGFSYSQSTLIVIMRCTKKEAVYRAQYKNEERVSEKS